MCRRWHRSYRFAVASADTTAPSAPANLAAQAGLDSASLTWTAASDNVAVSGYNVHRSSVAGFAPSTSNRIGVTTATAYTDAGLPPGSYFYVVTAQDAAGNVGAPSPELAVFVAGDTTAPTITISAPVDGSAASGMVQITATASDNVAVAGVQFQVDGASLGRRNHECAIHRDLGCVVGGRWAAHDRRGRARRGGQPRAVVDHGDGVECAAGAEAGHDGAGGLPVVARESIDGWRHDYRHCIRYR